MLIKTNKIAIAFKPNRFSQKLAKRHIFNTGTKYYELVPFNIKKYGNMNTLKKRANEFYGIIVWEYDEDIKELFDELEIKYKVFKPETKSEWKNYIRYNGKPVFRIDMLYIIKEIKEKLRIKEMVTCYTYDEETNKVICKQIEKAYVDNQHFYFESKEACIEYEKKQIEFKIKELGSDLKYFVNRLKKMDNIEIAGEE